MKALSVIAVNVGVLVALAFTAELVFGEWLGVSAMGRLAVPRNVKVVVSAAPLYPGGGEFLYQRDAMGFRGPGVDPARISILTIGGSTTNQLYLPEEATWQAVLERILRQTGHDVVVANAGIDGQSTAGMVADLGLWLLDIPGLKPRLVLAYVGINDVYKSGPATVNEGGGEDPKRPGAAVDHDRRRDSGRPGPIAASRHGFCAGAMDGSARPTGMAARSAGGQSRRLQGPAGTHRRIDRGHGRDAGLRHPDTR